MHNLVNNDNNRQWMCGKLGHAQDLVDGHVVRAPLVARPYNISPWMAAISLAVRLHALASICTVLGRLQALGQDHHPSLRQDRVHHKHGVHQRRTNILSVVPRAQVRRFECGVFIRFYSALPITLARC